MPMFKKYVLPVSICLVVLVTCIGVLQWRSINADDRIMNDIEASSGDASKTITENDVTVGDAPAYVENGALVIGERDAPVTILEFSSLSCPHCATFHKVTLGDLKTDYVDTGKVKFVFNDFPLNGPAMAGSLLLKCIPLENRYEFMEMLFDQQAQWAFDNNFNNKLKQYAALLGIGSARAEECMSDREAQAAIVAAMQTANEAYEISSTPSFVIQPGGEKLTGAQPYGEFSTRIEALINQEE